MSVELTPVEKRLAIARTWPQRFADLLEKKRKKNQKYSEAQFCRDHGFDYAYFNRAKNLRSIPIQKTVDSIEAALKKERV